MMPFRLPSQRTDPITSTNPAITLIVTTGLTFDWTGVSCVAAIWVVGDIGADVGSGFGGA